MSETAFILDTSSFIHRAYHASKKRPTFTKDGQPNAAVNLFRNMLQRLRRDHTMNYLVAACDVHAPTFRTKLYPEYKAQRLTPPADLVSQIPGCMAALRSEFIPRIELAGYEADDIIGTLARRITALGTDVVIVAGDKDMAQLVSVSHDGGEVRLLNTGKNKILNVAGVLDEYGVWPHQVVDYLALVGDTSDNVPGCTGIGPKGALELLKQFGTVEEILSRPGEIESGRYRHAIMCYADMVRLSKKLVTIDCNVPLPDDLTVITAKGGF